jgi:hypothetical protein
MDKPDDLEHYYGVATDYLLAADDIEEARSRFLRDVSDRPVALQQFEAARLDLPGTKRGLKRSGFLGDDQG